MPWSSTVFIGSIARTPIGSFLGKLSHLSAPQLGAVAIRAAIARAGLSVADVDEAIMGCVLSAGLGQAPARQAALGAGLPQSCPATTVNKMCASGMKAIMLADTAIRADEGRVYVAGGMESMSNAPHLMAGVRHGRRMENVALIDHMMVDGLEDAYVRGRPMGAFAEDCAQELQFSRRDQDVFAETSLARALEAQWSGAVTAEIAAITCAGGKEIELSEDEQPAKSDATKIQAMKPVFARHGTITAANASSISDGAAAIVLMSAGTAERLVMTPLARIVAQATFAQEPAKYVTAPVGAISRVVEKAGWRLTDVDLFEINEAFAVVALACMRQLGLSHQVVNVHGGACALGHPIGASGARIVVTLVNALRTLGLKRGVASACLGGGEATAVAIELVE